MGYYTEYTLEVRKIKNEEQFQELVEELKAHDLIGYAFDEGHFPAIPYTNLRERNKSHEALFYPYDEAKWYDHSAVMIMISEKFPNMYFELSGVGEDFGDFWKEYYHDGEVEECAGEIVYAQPKRIQWDKLMRF